MRERQRNYWFKLNTVDEKYLNEEGQPVVVKVSDYLIEQKHSGYVPDIKTRLTSAKNVCEGCPFSTVARGRKVACNSQITFVGLDGQETIHVRGNFISSPACNLKYCNIPSTRQPSPIDNLISGMRGYDEEWF